MPINGLGNLTGLLEGAKKTHLEVEFDFFFMQSISNIKESNNLKKEVQKVQRQIFFLPKYHLVLFSALFFMHDISAYNYDF